MDRSVEGLLNLGYVSGEDNDIARLRHLVDGKALRLQPRGDSGKVGVADTVLLAELRGREPLAVVGRIGVLQVAEILLEGDLLPVAALEHEHDAPGRHRPRRGSLVVFCLRQRMYVVLQGDAHIRIDDLRDAVGDDSFGLRLSKRGEGSKGEQPGGYERGQTRDDGARRELFIKHGHPVTLRDVGVELLPRKRAWGTPHSAMLLSSTSIGQPQMECRSFVWGCVFMPEEPRARRWHGCKAHGN